MRNAHRAAEALIRVTHATYLHRPNKRPRERSRCQGVCGVGAEKTVASGSEASMAVLAPRGKEVVLQMLVKVDSCVAGC